MGLKQIRVRIEDHIRRYLAGTGIIADERQLDFADHVERLRMNDPTHRDSWRKRRMRRHLPEWFTK